MTYRYSVCNFTSYLLRQITPMRKSVKIVGTRSDKAPPSLPFSHHEVVQFISQF